MDYAEINRKRRSTRDYDPAFKASRSTLERILNQAALAPSAYNMQGYRVVVVMSEKEKEKLYAVGNKQNQILTSSAMLIVLANLEAYRGLRHILEQSQGVDGNTIEAAVRGNEKFYNDNPKMARDEALRTASLFAMNFMLAAENEGYQTGPMIGFDAAAVCREFGIEHPYFPAMLISFGKVTKVPGPRGFRVPASEFARFL